MRRFRQCVVCSKTIDIDRIAYRGAYRGFWTLYGCAVHSDEEWKEASDTVVKRLMSVDDAQRRASARAEDDLGDIWD